MLDALGFTPVAEVNKTRRAATLVYRGRAVEVALDSVAGLGTFVEDAVPKIDRAERDRAIDESLDRLLVEAHTTGMALEELGWRLSRRIEEFRRRRNEEEKKAPGGEGDTP